MSGAARRPDLRIGAAIVIAGLLVVAWRPAGIAAPAGKYNVLFLVVDDLRPELVDVCGLAMPDGLEGTSLAPVLDAPDRAWKKAAFSQYPRHGGKIMGYSMRTDCYRYTEWKQVADGSPMGVEVYDHANDPDENVNVADRPEYKELTAQLSRQFHAGWRAALPADARPGDAGKANNHGLRQE